MQPMRKSSYLVAFQVLYCVWDNAMLYVTALVLLLIECADVVFATDNVIKHFLLPGPDGTVCGAGTTVSHIPEMCLEYHGKFEKKEKASYFS